MKKIKIFISSNKKFILSNRMNDDGNIDFIDKNKKLRNKIYKIIKKNNLIFAKRFHATGERYDIITKKLDIYSLDFLDGYETNPLFFDFSKIKNNQKIKIKLSFSLFVENFNIFFLNIFKYFFYRIYTLFSQKPTMIEFYGVDGSGKSYFSKVFKKKLEKRINLKIFHLWNNKGNKKQISPYLKKNYVTLISFIKEIFILSRIILLYLYINFFTQKKTLYLFERSLYDTYLDPERYRMCHSPRLIIFFLKKMFFKTFKILIYASYKKVSIRKNELNIVKFQELNKSFRNIKFDLIIKN